MSLPVDKVLRKAQSHIKAGELAEAEELYKQVLSKFPKNKKAIQEYQKLKAGITSKGLSSSEPPKEKVQELMSLYNHGQFDEVLSKAKPLASLFPRIIVLHNLVAAANGGLKNLDQAIESFNKVLEINPEDAMAYFNIGTIFSEKEEFDTAIKNYQKCLSIKPNHAEAYDNMGSALKAQGKLTTAIEQFTQAINLKPNFAQAHYNLGVVLQETGNSHAAIESHKKALEINPNYFKSYNNMGNALKDKDELNAAIESYEQAIKIKPEYAEAHYNMGIALNDKGESDAAINTYKQAIKIKPEYADAYYNMGIALKDKGEVDPAIGSYKQAIKIKPDYAEAFNNMGIALKEKGELDAAIGSYNQALKIKPDYADAYNNMGIALNDKGELDAAIDSYKQAIKIKPDYAEAYYNSSFALLNSGRLKEGLDEYEWRWKTPPFLSMQRHFLQPLWDGKTSLQDKRILVWCEQGVGDTIIWSSRLSLLVSQAGHCILECQEKLVPLLSRSFPNVEVKPVDVRRDTTRDDFDFHLPMASLYRHFITEITQNPRPEAFLIPDPVRVKFWKDRLSSLGSGPYVGISWKSSLMGAERWKRFCSISEWSSLLTLPNINFINLQYADSADGLLQIQNEFGVKVHNFDDLDQYNNLDDVAALSAALDCVVSFSTSVPMITAGVGTLTKCALLANGNYNNILGGPVGPLVDKFEKNTCQPWSNVLGLIAEDIAKL